MHPIIRNTLAVIAGIAVSSAVNLGLINVGGSIIPPPEGVDVTTMEGLKEAMPQFQPKHFIMPFLAHALGAFVGALLAALIAGTHKMKFAIGIGAFFLLGGIYAAVSLPAPTWYIILDLVCAYIPMGYIAGKLVGRKN
jgi:hypothetical protein